MLINSAIRWLSASRLRFAVAVALLLLGLHNARFWQATIAAVWRPTLADSAFVMSLASVLLAVHVAVLFMIPGRRAPAWIAAMLLLVAACSGYFLDHLGVFIDKEMLRNVSETDAVEVAGLVTPGLLAQVALLGVLPALVVMRVQLPAQSLPGAVLSRVAVFANAVLVIAVAAVPVAPHYASFLREHKPLRYLLNPLSTISAATRLLAARFQHDGPVALQDTGGAVIFVDPRTARPLLLFLVIGETARAANFGLGGYERDTTPRLRLRNDLVYVADVETCGTSTAYSLPCMLSPLRRSQFDIDVARRQTNVLDAFVRAGFDVEWRDNNSGCKGLCTRVRFVPFSRAAGGDRCAGELCLDHTMHDALAEQLRRAPRSTLIVFHQAGSHGPAYAERYPRRFERFIPACRSRELDECTLQEIVNAYDNTLLYTDYVLASQIALLESLNDVYDTALLYVSDHGESLGEQGLYLHGAPYFVAPRTQTRVPMVIWTSAQYRAGRGLQLTCLQRTAQKPASHDHVYHTLLGIAGFRNRAYRPDLDLLAPCRHDQDVPSSRR
ncbi:MAG: phosphoethanolamine--lipid A transferase [Steroidobacteraceae bacterium]|nr:phosphoethanolamine--lipid A transferase [Steroidobacteraceae bacterium]MDW8257880.1 phosphoethanolamine--lipid A transferase [Gammaproteobacteria bacterium]